MIYKSFALFCFFVFIACQNQKDSSSKSEVKTEASPQTEEKAVAKPPFTDLESFVGKNASEVQLFAKYQLNERLKAIMGSEYMDFNTGWKDLGIYFKFFGPYGSLYSTQYSSQVWRSASEDCLSSRRPLQYFWYSRSRQDDICFG